MPQAALTIPLEKLELDEEQIEAVSGGLIGIGVAAAVVEATIALGHAAYDVGHWLGSHVP